MSADRPPGPIATPCVQVCYVDGKTRHCLGCFRTLPEIAKWQRLTDAERAAVMADLPARKQRIEAERAAP